MPSKQSRHIVSCFYQFLSYTALPASKKPAAPWADSAWIRCGSGTVTDVTFWEKHRHRSGFHFLSSCYCHKYGIRTKQVRFGWCKHWPCWSFLLFLKSDCYFPSHVVQILFLKWILVHERALNLFFPGSKHLLSSNTKTLKSQPCEMLYSTAFMVLCCYFPQWCGVSSSRWAVSEK